MHAFTARTKISTLSFLKLTFLAMLVALIPSSTLAADKAAATTAFLPSRFEIYLSSGYIGYGSGSKQFDIAPGFQLQLWQPWLQVGAEVTYQKISYQEGSASNMILQAGPTVNYESFLLSLGAALKSGSAGDTSASSSSSTAPSSDPNGFGYYFMVGRHFVLFPGFSMRPTIGIVATGATSFVIRPFALSYSF